MPGTSRNVISPNPLYLENQVSHTILDRVTLRQLLIFSLNLIACVKLDEDAA